MGLRASYIDVWLGQGMHMAGTTSAAHTDRLRLPSSLQPSFVISGTFPHTFLSLTGLLISVAYIPCAYTLPCIFSLKLLVRRSWLSC